MPPAGWTKFDEDRREAYLNALRDGNLKHASARIAGVSYKTIERYRAANEEFHKDERIAQAEASEQVEKVLHDMALEGDLGAIKIWLHAHAKSTYNDKKELTIDATPAALEASKANALASVADLQKVLAERHAEMAELESGPKVINVGEATID